MTTHQRFGVCGLGNVYLLHQHKLCVDGDQSPRFGELVRGQELVLNKTSVSIARAIRQNGATKWV